MTDDPVGVIDSGMGGLSVLRHLITDMQQESFVYFADSSFCPYGQKEFKEIRQRLKKIVDFLIETYSVKTVVVACNTATAASIDFLRESYTIPFVGMEPAIKPAALSTKSKVIGVLATEGTFNGRLFKQTREKFTSGIKVNIQAGNGLVELIESGITEGSEIEKLLIKYISPMINENADLIVLGCTHFPFLQKTINKLFPQIELIDPAPAVSKQTLNILSKYGILGNKNQKETIFLTTGNTSQFDLFLSKQMNISAKSKHVTI
ncbi:MAG TPA: glutamate racemase [Salinivirgaceae bacterium]|nr:glutamate racemase [Salinivirgaceae bacterium]